jgi:hypothetical protein
MKSQWIGLEHEGRRADPPRLFDVSNIDAEGNILQPGTQRYILGKGNQVFHVDSSFNPRRCGTVS